MHTDSAPFTQEMCLRPTSFRVVAIYTPPSCESGIPDVDFLRLAGLAMPHAMQSVSGIRTSIHLQAATDDGILALWPTTHLPYAR